MTGLLERCKAHRRPGLFYVSRNIRYKLDTEMTMNLSDLSKYTILTGAGFTHNFGGFLSKSMWAEIHNRYQRYTAHLDERQIESQLKNNPNFDYEDIYQSIVDSNEYNEYEKNAFLNAVLDAYGTLDDIIRDHKNPSHFIASRPVNFNHFKAFLSRFTVDEKSAFFFTLNQDLLIERYFYDINPLLLGIKARNKRFDGCSDKTLTEEDYVEISTDMRIDETLRNNLTGGFLNYIKLHGSYDWRDQKNRSVLIIGTNKKAGINQVPLLRSYFDLFKIVLSQPNRKLLIIGYGFKDRHINELIADAVVSSNLKIFIISPHDPEYFKKSILGFNQGWNDRIWKALRGYYPYLLKDIFPHGDETYISRNLMNDYFS